MMLITKADMDTLLSNGRKSAASPDGSIDHKPVIKLFSPDGNSTWLLTEIDPDDNDIAYGLCDLGMGFPEMGPVSLAEIQRARGRMGLKIERDRHFRASKTISQYADEASEAGRIRA